MCRYRVCILADLCLILQKKSGLCAQSLSGEYLSLLWQSLVPQTNAYDRCQQVTSQSCHEPAFTLTSCLYAVTAEQRSSMAIICWNKWWKFEKRTFSPSFCQYNNVFFEIMCSDLLELSKPTPAVVYSYAFNYVNMKTFTYTQKVLLF